MAPLDVLLDALAFAAGRPNAVEAPLRAASCGEVFVSWLAKEDARDGVR